MRRTWVTPRQTRALYMVLKISRTSEYAPLPWASPCPGPSQIILLPCGGVSYPRDTSGEGAIEIKAAWRALTPTEATSGRFYMRNVIFYTGPPIPPPLQPGQKPQVYNNAVWGLVALHIIHKTKSFPAFVFASWEQVDNYDDAATRQPKP